MMLGGSLYCIVLYCIVLYCIVLYCIVLYCIVLYCIVLYCIVLYYLLTNWLAYLYRRIQSPRPDVMPDRREGITRAAGFVFAYINKQAS